MTFHFYKDGSYVGASSSGMEQPKANEIAAKHGWTIGEAPTITPTEDEVRAEGARRLEAIASAYRPQERETWHKQISEAKAYDADSQAPTPFLSAMAAQTGETVQEIVTRVLANDAAFTAAAGAVLGAQRAILALDPIPTDYADDSRWP